MISYDASVSLFERGELLTDLNPQLISIPLNFSPEEIEAVNTGMTDGFFADTYSANSIVADNPDLTCVQIAEGEHRADMEFVIYTAKGSDLTELINDALATISEAERQQIMNDVISVMP